MGRAIAIEYPGIWGGLIDLQFDGDRTSDIDLLAAELLHPNGETQIAISAAGQRNVPRFVRQSLAELPAQLPRVRTDATYLVTGGLGMLGRTVSKWLLSKGAKHLVLTGRSASSKAAHEVFSTAEINSATIRVVAADISLDEDVSRLMHDVSAWVGEGRIKYREDVVEGLKNAPQALIGLLRGENFGKLLVRVAYPSS